MKKALSILLCLCLVCGLLAGCGQTPAETPEETPADAAPEGAAPEDAAPVEDESGSENPVVRIGVFEPQTGDNGAGGKQEILGMQYANYIQAHRRDRRRGVRRAAGDCGQPHDG